MRHTKNSERNIVLFINIIFKSLLDSIKSKFNNKSIVIKIGVANLYAGVKIIQTVNTTTDKDKYFNEYVDHTIRIANAEGLTAHAIAAKKRLES